ncbi:MAG: biotin--[acetyl-CoA-carboxylase] ligase [Legionellaceae bacterium]|nr:biotin--[acetyl-CoA-carboxylase] ligase [Legionellaceae bacterium]
MNPRLNPAEISQALNRLCFTPTYQLWVDSCVTSTNDRAKHHPPSDDWIIITAEEQTAGRGRFGRVWDSPNGGHLYLSIRMIFPRKDHSVAGLSLLAGVMIAMLLDDLGVPSENLGLKWPNDVWFAGKKLSGILIELEKADAENWYVIVGIGLNVHEVYPENMSRISLCQVMPSVPWNRNLIIAQMLARWNVLVTEYKQQGLSPWMGYWKSKDILLNKWITLHQAQKKVSGISLGITTRGELRLQLLNGEVINVSSGEASLGGQGVYLS